MSFFMQTMEETEKQTTYSITLENLALGNGEIDGETGVEPVLMILPCEL